MLSLELFHLNTVVFCFNQIMYLRLIIVVIDVNEKLDRLEDLLEDVVDRVETLEENRKSTENYETVEVKK